MAFWVLLGRFARGRMGAFLNDILPIIAILSRVCFKVRSSQVHVFRKVALLIRQSLFLSRRSGPVERTKFSCFLQDVSSLLAF